MLPGHDPIVGFDLPPETRARVLWLTADLALRDGDDGRARSALDELIALDGDYPEARQRRASITPSA